MPHDESKTVLVRAALTRPNSYDPQTRTVSAVIATTNPVQRRDARGPYLEILTADTLDLSAVAGLPVLDSHRTQTVRDQIGRVRSIAVEGEAVVALLELTSAEDAVPVVQRIADGTVSGVSIGYRVAGWIETQTPQGRVKTPSGWRISEVTLTSNPADPSARLRQEESTMPDPVIETQTVPTPEAVETQRRSDIRGLVRSAGLGPEIADDLIDAGSDMTAAKATVFDALEEKRRSAPIIRTHAPANDDPAVVLGRQAQALHIRMTGGDCPEESRQYMGESLLDMARGSLARAGVSTRGLSADEVFTRAATHTTSDFPLTVSNAMNKTALSSYQAAESPLKTLCRQRTLPNFKESTAIRLGEMGRLEPLDENGEITHTSRGENGEKMNLKTFARGITVSRKLMIDDDLGLLGDMTSAMGEAAAQTEADILVALVIDNPNLSDGTPVFDASRGNVGAVAAPTVAALTESRQAMRTRTGLDGETIISAAPRYVLVPADLETEAEQVLASIQPNATADVNPFGGKLSLLVEPRLPAATWYVFADPVRLAAMQYAYLSSAQGVQIQRTEAWDTLGMKYRAFLDFGAGWLDWRGTHQIPGA
uniref:prohead protease/major capsid protein fusion protein n=1 Tax=Pararhizobium sp. IMCC3301 TaxID=3067904 RepID=UPI002742396B|nr:prohead protease/major capsid protein fusion protein [Pararhizobium sp. IMCC3301]